MKIKKILVFSLTMLLIVASLPFAPLVNAAMDEANAINALKTAWEALEVENSEIIAVPDIAKDFTKATTEEVASEMGTSLDKVGPYYAEFTVSGGNGSVNYKTLDGKLGLGNLNRYDKMELFIDRTDAEGDSSLAFSPRNTSYGEIAQAIVHPGLNSFDEASALGTVLTDVDISVYFINLACYENGKSFRVGSIIGYYTQKPELPENTEGWTAEKWIAAAQNITGTIKDEAFLKALRDLREFTEDGKLYNALQVAWENLELECSEVIAVPDIAKDFTKATTEEVASEMGTTLDKVGPYYAEFTVSGGNVGFNYKTIDGQLGLGSLSAYDRVEFFIDRTDAEGDSSLAFSPRNTASAEIAQVIVHPGLNSFDEASALGTVLTDADISVYFINLACYENGKSFRVGSVIGYYNQKAETPEGIALLSLRDLVKMASRVSLTGYDSDSLNIFANALSEAKLFLGITDDEEAIEKKEQLIQAWQKLGVQSSEFVAAPDVAQAFTKSTTEQIATEMGSTLDEIGPYYAEFTVSGGNGGVNYKTLEGKLGLKSLYGYEKVELFIDRTDSEANNTLVFSVRRPDFSEIAQLHAHPGLNSFGQSSAIGSIFTEQGNTIHFINLACYENGSTFRVGSLKGYYNEYAALPDGYELMSFSTLFAYASSLNLSGYNIGVSEFSSVLASASDIVEDIKERDETTLKNAWQALGLTPPENNVLEAAMALDLSTAINKEAIPSFEKALYSMRMNTKEGYVINEVKNSWEGLGKELPKDFVQMTAESIMSAALALDTSGCEENTIMEFEDKVGDLVDFLTTGSADATALTDLLKKAIEANMDSLNFSPDSWKNFQSAIDNATEVLNSLDKQSQRTVDNAFEDLISAWDGLEAFNRTLFIDFYQYYQNEPGVTAKTEPATYNNAATGLVRDLELPNGVLTGTKVIHQENRFLQAGYSGIKFQSLVGKEYLELYLKAEEGFNYSDGARINFALSNGNHIWRYDLNLKPEDEGKFVRYLIPLDEGAITYQSETLPDKLNEYQFDQKMPLRALLFFYANCYGDITMSSVAVIDTFDVEAGTTPTIPVMKQELPVEIKPEPPKNPIDGVDRGDPWGDTVVWPIEPVEKETYDDTQKETYDDTQKETYDDTQNVTQVITTTQTFSKGGIKADGTKVEAADVLLSVKNVTKGSVFSGVKKSLKKLTNRFIVFDIALVSDDEVLTPDGKVSIQLNIPDTFDKDKTHFFSSDNSGKLYKLDFEIKGSKLVFETDKLGYFVMAEEVVNTEMDGTGVNILLIVMLCVAFVVLISTVLIVVIIKKRGAFKRAQ